MENPIPDNPFAEDAGKALLMCLFFGIKNEFVGLTDDEYTEMQQSESDLKRIGGAFLAVEALRPAPAPQHFVIRDYNGKLSDVNSPEFAALVRVIRGH